MSEITAVPDALNAEPPGPTRRLRGNLGVASIVFMVVAAAAPLGVIGGVVPLGIAAGNGAGFPATFVVSTVILLFFAVGFTALTPYVEEAGAFFSYVRTALGFPAGIGIAFVALVSYVAIEAGVYGLLGPAGGVIVELFGGPALPWWVFAAVAFSVTTFVGYRNIELSSRVLAILLSAEIAIVVVLDAVIVFQGGDHGLSSGIVTPSAIFSGSLGIGLLFALISYVGFEATAIFRDEAKTPERTISGATFLADTAQRYIGVVGTDLITVLYFTSLFACILSFHNVASRYIFALSQRHVLPESLSRPHDRHGSPHQASLWISGVVAVSIIAAVVFKLDPAAQFYTRFAGATTVGIVVLLIATSVAVLVYFARDRRGYSQWRVRIAPALGLLGLTVGLVLIVANLEDLVGGSTILGWAIVGLLVVAFIAGVVVGKRVGERTVTAP